MTNVIELDSRRVFAPRDTTGSRRAEAERVEWLRIWSVAWAAEARRRGKTLSHSERQRYAAYVRGLVDEIQRREGSRSGKVVSALNRAAEWLSTTQYRRERGCPPKLALGSRQAEYRIDRFTSENPKSLRGKLMDWLAVVEALADVLERSPRREVARFHEAGKYGVVKGASSDRASQLSEGYDAVFEEIALDLTRICERVARRFDASAYYDFCEKNHAAFNNGKLVPCDGWARRFNRFDFEPGGWIELEDGSYWEDPWARSPLGPIGEVLIHAPLGRVSLGLVELVHHPELASQFFPALEGEWLSLELDVHLTLRADVEEPSEAGALLIHPFIGLLASSPQSPTRTSADWWSSTGQIAVESVQPSLVNALRAAAPPPTDQYQQRALQTILEHAGFARVEPLTRESCQAWLSFGANDVAPEFWNFFDERAHGLDVPPVVSAPEGTLAGFIQMNLLTQDMSPEVHNRLDHLLAADAARKVGEAKRVLQEKVECFARLRSSSSALRHESE